MNDPGPDRFRLLATFLAGRSLEVAEAQAGEAAYTNGQVVFVSAGQSREQQRREVVLQSALLGGGSLDRRYVTALRGRPSLARRYLALEGCRALVGLAGQLPLGAALQPPGGPNTASADESLAVARSRAGVADPPAWFGVIKPSRLNSAPDGGGAAAGRQELHLQIPTDAQAVTEDHEDKDDSDSEYRESKVLKLLDSPLGSSRGSSFLQRLLGRSRAGNDEAQAGAAMQSKAVRRARSVGADARPLPARIHFTDDGKSGAAMGVKGALHPEWDVFNKRYRHEWCRVLDFPLTAAADVAAGNVPSDEVMRRRLSRVGLGPMVLRGRPDGDELDHEALIDMFVDQRSGYSPQENVYTERRKLARNLGVLILVDASGSAVDTDRDGQAVHDHQRLAAAVLAATLEELGDRVAVYAFRSHGRHAVHLPAIKTFDQRFGAVGRACLNQLKPDGYTRLGAGIRGAGEILKNESGTPNRLLVLLSDGHPYDDGYEGRYAEADARKALEELRTDGVACLCLSIGADTGADALERVFGSSSYAAAESLAELSPRMDELFLGPLRELGAPVARTARSYGASGAV